MISPSCPIIMDATSTTSSYNMKERNDHSELMCSNVANCKDGLTENEILEESNQDPEDEDTLSDDSLRLRFSDDEADISDTVSSNKPAALCISSEQMTSQDTTTGLTNSTKKIPIDAAEHSTYNSCESASNIELLKSNQNNEILNEVRNRSENNKKKMWRGGNRKVHSLNNIIQTNKRPFPGHTFQSRHYHNNSSICRSEFYFNNHINFGRPSGFRKHGNHWKNSKGKCVPRSFRQVQKKAVNEEVANFELQLSSKLNVNIELSQADQSALSNSTEQAPLEVGASDSSANPPGALSSSNLNSKERLQIPVASNNDTLAIVNDELSKECSHLNLDQASFNGSGGLEKADKNDTNLVNNENSTNYNCDLRFASDDWLNEPIARDNEHMQATENFSSSSSQDSSDFKRTTSSLSLENTESTASSESKNAITMSDETVTQNNNLDSSDSLKETIKLDIGNKLLEIKSHSDVGADTPGDIQKEVETNNHACETFEQRNEVGDSLKVPETDEPDATSSKLWAPEKQSTTEQMPEQLEKESIENEELQTTSEVVNSGEKHESDNKDDVNIEEEKKDDTSLSNEQEVAEQASDKLAKEEESSKYKNNQCEISAPAKNKRKFSSDNKETELVEHISQKPKTLNSNEKTVRNQLVDSESSDQSDDNSVRKSTEKNSLKLQDNQQSEPLLVMKRSLTDSEKENDKLIHKKMKIAPDSNSDISAEQLRSQNTLMSPVEEIPALPAEKSDESPKNLCYVRKFFQRDMKGKLTKLKREELEELIIQKLVETLTMQSEIGKLREQARISERNQEANRIRCQQLTKQINDFDMVLNRNAADRRVNNDKPMPPIKINRSVGLQVNFISEQGIQNLRSLSSNNISKSNVPNPVTVNGGNKLAKPENNKTTTVPRRGIKIRSPRRIEVTKNVPIPIQPQISTAMPKATLVLPKPVDTSPKLSVANTSKEQVLPSAISPQPTAAKIKNIVVNGKISNHTNRQSTVPNNQSTVSSDLIDLTEEEDKNKPISGTISGVLPMVATITSSIGPKVPNTRYQRVVQTALSPNVAITTQAANIRVVQSVSQPTPTALVNNINATKLAYVMQGSLGTGRQLLIAPNPNQVRPVTSTTRGQFSNVPYKAGTSTLANGTVRVLTTAATTIPPSPSNPPPAPLPDTPHYPHRNGWKLPPPPPSLKISKVTQGIVLSWNMVQSDNYADIASYQLYAYQEIPGTVPNSNLWKKVGDVRALPLPMACTLKEFTPGNNYHFAVRAVDRHSRFGQYSVPRNISL